VSVAAQLTELSVQIKSAYSTQSTFAATKAFVITWYQVPFDSDHSKLNTFQVVLVTDGTNSFLIANYDRLDHATADHYPVNYNDYYYNEILYNGLTTTSNCGVPGRWIFQVQDGSARAWRSSVALQRIYA
jgi:hypothetical protein